MIEYNPIAESNNFIILEKYIRQSIVAEGYQSEGDLERELVADLQNQGYEYRLDLNNQQALLGDVSRSQIEDAVGLIPQQWHLDSVVRSSLASFLFQRASYVAETIESRLLNPPQLTTDLSDGGES